VIVTGADEPDRKMEAQLRGLFGPYARRVTVEFLAGLPHAELLARLATLERHTVVYASLYYRDGSGRSFVPRAAVEEMVAASSAPVYGSYATFIGTGIVGGYMPSFEEMGRQAGLMVNQLLAGAAPAAVRRPPIIPQTLNVDWRQVLRWGVDRSAIPPDAVVHFKVQSQLETFRKTLFASLAAAILQAALIGLLLVERRRRRQAELAEKAQRLRLAHASRLAVVGELTGSIAHEINQPLGAILTNADAAGLILDSGLDRRDELKSILADIRRDDRRASEVIRRLRTLLARHEVEREPFDVDGVVRDVESFLREEARRRRVSLQVRAASSATMVGDRFQIQQVLINLVLNAMDAVADLPEERRTVAVTVRAEPDRVILVVRDEGPGISPEHLPKLFDSFFSTKREGMGLGLSIARTLVEAHGGRIRAENGPGRGASFSIELPRGAGGGSTGAV
jgi:signal transduction histidine kinase